MGKFLRVNLSKGKIMEQPLDERLARDYVGGIGFGARLLYDEVHPGIDPFSPENKLMFLTGPLQGTEAPTSGRIGVVTKSPLTGIWGEAKSGGYLGPEIKRAGYDGVIIEGRAEKPVYLWVEDGKAEIRSATHLWGKTTDETEKIILEEVELPERILEEVVVTARVACIGPAGERLVRYASIISDRYRAAARCGVGAVMGSKNLKAVAVRGTMEVKVARPKEFEKTVEQVKEILNADPFTSKETPTYGTLLVLPIVNLSGALPTRNFQTGVFEAAEQIGPEALVSTLVVDKYGCDLTCDIIECGKYVKLNGEIFSNPQYESVTLLGSNCGIDDLKAIAKANVLCNRYGLDTISTGSSIGFAMECYEKGLLTKEDTDGVELKFGNSEVMLQMIDKIAKREGLGDVLAEGVRRASEKIGKGAQKLAMHVKGLEMPAYDPRAAKGGGLGYAIAPRGACHANAPGTQAAELHHVVDPLIIEGKPGLVIRNENFTVLPNSMMICIFVEFALGNPENVWVHPALLSSVTGFSYGPEANIPAQLGELLRIGERICNLRRAFNVREGISRKDDTLPERVMKEPMPAGPAKGHRVTKEDLDMMLDEYYKLRGWDSQGIPTEDKLTELGLQKVAEDLRKHVVK